MPDTDSLEYMLEPARHLKTLLRAEDPAALEAFVQSLPPGDVARTLTLLDHEERTAILQRVDPETAAELLRSVVDAHGADLLEALPPPVAAAIANEMDSHHLADVLGELNDEDIENILHRMEPTEAAEARELLKYDEDTAGGIMTTEFVSYAQGTTVSEVIDDIRAHAETYSDYGVQYIYVESDSGSLIGVVRMRDLLLSPANRKLKDIMLVNPVYVLSDTPLDEIGELFDRYTFWVFPVVDERGHLVGLVRRAEAEEALGEEHERTFLRFSGIIGGEELRSMPLRERTSRRMIWLSLNMGLSVLAASVILLFEDTIDSAFALVFFMPVICNMSGCSGNQAVAVSIRELTLRLIKPRDFARVWAKELGVGLFNGIVLGAGLGIVAQLIWHDRPALGVIIGTAFALNVLFAVSLGGLIPLLLKAFKLDPALGAPPILTTLTDMCGFLLLLSLATAALYLGWL